MTDGVEALHPLPWRVEPSGDGLRTAIIDARDCTVMATLFTDLPAFIVEAVNAKPKVRWRRENLIDLLDKSLQRLREIDADVVDFELLHAGALVFGRPDA